LRFDLEPEMGDAHAADGAMTSHGKKCGKISFSNLGNMYIFGKPCISGIRKYINNSKYVTPKLKMTHNGTRITHGET
jgi:hypothetical protein